MGYELHITRKKHWASFEGPQISFEEWLKYAETDQDLLKDRFEDSESEARDFVFLDHPEGLVPLCWFEGAVYVKNPDKQTVKKLITIASNLHAHVVGDDDEPYTDWTKFPLPTPKSSITVSGLLERIFS